MDTDTRYQTALMQGVAANLRTVEATLNYLRTATDGRALAEVENIHTHIEGALLAAGMRPVGGDV